MLQANRQRQGELLGQRQLGVGAHVGGALQADVVEGAERPGLVDEPAAVLGVLADQRDAERAARDTGRRGAAAAIVDAEITLYRPAAERAAQSDAAGGAGVAADGAVAGQARAYGQAVGHAVVDHGDDARRADLAGLDAAAEVDDGDVLLHGAEPDGNLAGLELAGAEVDPPHLFAGLTLRAVEDQADGVEPDGQRHIEELVAPLDRRGA